VPAPNSDDDDALVAALADALREAREVPSAFVRAGRELFILRDLDLELAELVHDSSLRPPATAATRSDDVEHASIRDVTFESNSLVVSLQILGRGAQGQVVEMTGSQAPDEVDVSRVSGTVEIRSDVGQPVVATIREHGWFAFPSIPQGRIRLLCRTAAGGTVLTAAITV
jgi:hypothetical protein